MVYSGKHRQQESKPGQQGWSGMSRLSVCTNTRSSGHLLWKYFRKAGRSLLPY
jgi:hypothetical protein